MLMGGKPVLGLGSSWKWAWKLRWEGAQAGFLDCSLLSCTYDQEPGMGSSSGQDPGLPWLPGWTGVQRAPNPGHEAGSW